MICIWAVLSDNASSGNTDFFENSRKRVKTDFISLRCETRHDNYFLLFSSLVDTFLFDQEMEPKQAEPPLHAHGQQPLLE